MNALGCTAVGMMLIGGTIVPLDRFHPDQLVADHRAERGDDCPFAGRDPCDLLKRPEASMTAAIRRGSPSAPPVSMSSTNASSRIGSICRSLKVGR